MDYKDVISRLQESWKPTSKEVEIVPGLVLEFQTANALDMLTIGAATNEKDMLIETLRLAKVEPKMTYEDAANLLSMIPGSEFDRLYKDIAAAIDTKGVMTIQQKVDFLEETPTPDQLSISDLPSTNGLAKPSEGPEKISSGSRRRAS